MTCNRDKNSVKGKDVHWGLPLHAELWGGKFRKWLAIVTRTLWKGRMCIEDYHCMQSFGGGSLENDLQSWQELCEREGCALRTTIACRALGGGKFIKRLAMVTRTLCKGRMCIEEYHCMQSFGGGKFKKRLATVRRTLCKGRMCIEEYHRMQSFGGGSLENDLQWWQELYAREGCACRNTIACRAFRGGSLENDLQPWEELYAREGCALRTTIACRALGAGKFRKWLAIVTRTLWKGRMCIEDYHCMQSFGGGGSSENDLQWWQELYAREGFALMTTIACRALGGEVYKKTCNGDKNSMQGKDVHWGIPLHAELWGGEV